VSIGALEQAQARMGALASHAQAKDVAERVAELSRGAEVVCSAKDGFNPIGIGVAEGAFFAPTLLLAKNAIDHAAHDVEAFGPVSTLMPYDGIDEAVALAARGRGSLVGTLVTKDPATAAHVVPQIAAWHGRLLVLDREAAVVLEQERQHLAEQVRLREALAADHDAVRRLELLPAARPGQRDQGDQDRPGAEHTHPELEQEHDGEDEDPERRDGPPDVHHGPGQLGASASVTQP